MAYEPDGMRAIPAYFPVPSTRPEIFTSIFGESFRVVLFSVPRKGGKGTDTPPGQPGSKGQSDSALEPPEVENTDENLPVDATEFLTETNNTNDIVNTRQKKTVNFRN